MEPSYMQMRAQMSKFDDGADLRQDKGLAVYDPTAMAAPGRRVRSRGKAPQGDTAATQRQVQQQRASAASGAGSALHPAADWAGVVPKASYKKFTAPEFAVGAKQQSLGPGLLPTGPDEDMAVGTAARGKKHFKGDVRFASVDPTGASAPMRSAVYQEGPGGGSAAEWKTATHAQMERQPRYGRRASGKKIPAFNPMELRPDAEAVVSQRVAAARQAEVRSGAGAAAGGGGGAGAGGGAGIAMGGSRGGGAAKHGRRAARGAGGMLGTGPNSLLSGIAASLAKDTSLAPPPSSPSTATPHSASYRAIPGYQGHRPSASGAMGTSSFRGQAPTGGSTPTDDQLRSQYLLHGNYKPAVPGYTGHLPKNPALTKPYA